MLDVAIVGSGGGLAAAVAAAEKRRQRSASSRNARYRRTFEIRHSRHSSLLRARPEKTADRRAEGSFQDSMYHFLTGRSILKLSVRFSNHDNAVAS